MSTLRYYSPRIARPLITRLYHEAKRRGIPMTALTDELIAKGLPMAQPESETQAEEPKGSNDEV